MTDLIQELYNKQNTTIDILKKQLLKTPLCKLKIMDLMLVIPHLGITIQLIDQLKRNLIWKSFYSFRYFICT